MRLIRDGVGSLFSLGTERKNIFKDRGRKLVGVSTVQTHKIHT